MVIFCCVPLCQSYQSTPKKSSLTFHGFPKNETLQIQWLKATRRDRLDKNGLKTTHTLTKLRNARVCSKHFKKSDIFIFGLRNILRKDAVPSVFPWNQTDVDKSQGIQNKVEPTFNKPKTKCTATKSPTISTKRITKKFDLRVNKNVNETTQNEIKESDSNSIIKYVDINEILLKTNDYDSGREMKKINETEKENDTPLKPNKDNEDGGNKTKVVETPRGNELKKILVNWKPIQETKVKSHIFTSADLETIPLPSDLWISMIIQGHIGFICWEKNLSEILRRVVLYNDMSLKVYVCERQVLIKGMQEITNLSCMENILKEVNKLDKCLGANEKHRSKGCLGFVLSDTLNSCVANVAASLKRCIICQQDLANKGQELKREPIENDF